jgi:hypothetical protein
MNTFEIEHVSYNADHFSKLSEKEFTEYVLKEAFFSRYAKVDQLKLIAESYKGIQQAVKK